MATIVPPIPLTFPFPPAASSVWTFPSTLSPTRVFPLLPPRVARSSSARPPTDIILPKTPPMARITRLPGCLWMEATSHRLPPGSHLLKPRPAATMPLPRKDRARKVPGWSSRVGNGMFPFNTLCASLYIPFCAAVPVKFAAIPLDPYATTASVDRTNANMTQPLNVGALTSVQALVNVLARKGLLTGLPRHRHPKGNAQVLPSQLTTSVLLHLVSRRTWQA